MIDESARARWAAAAERYGAGWAQAGTADLGWLVEAVAPTPTDRAIDIGCGGGHVALAVAGAVAHVTGVDPTPEMRAVAERLAGERGATNVRFVAGSAAALPFPDAAFDIAVSRFSMHHWPDQAAGLREGGRVLRGAGRLAIADLIAPEDPAAATFLGTIELLRDPSHVRSIPVPLCLDLLAAAGIRAAVVRTWSIRHDTESWLEQTDPAAWRADAVRRLLREASPGLRAALEIAADGGAFSVPCGLVSGVRVADS